MSHTIFGIVGWKNSGKTTLLEAIIRELSRRGYRVSTIKHAHHAFDIDFPGKDSYRHREAGAQEVIVASRQRWVLMHELRGAQEPALSDLLAHMAPCDLVLIEGFKGEDHPKIEVVRSIGPEGRIADFDETVLAVASPTAALAGPHKRLPLDDIGVITDFVVRQCALLPKRDKISASSF